MLELIDRALAEDLGQPLPAHSAEPSAAGLGDLTTAAVVEPGARARARIEQKAPGVPAGLRVAEKVFERVDPDLRWHAHADEGEWSEGGLLAELAGSASSILAGERVALNFLGRLSGIATLTARYVEAVEGTGVAILDTRKTTPGMRALEKEAVRAGGGVSHRSGLFDAILVKENHATLAGGVAVAARLALEAAAREDVTVEVECGTLEEVAEALDAGVERVLLDNMTPDQMHLAVRLATGRAELEASGGITLDTIRAVAETGVDYISIGALTHSAPALDLSLGLGVTIWQLAPPDPRHAGRPAVAPTGSPRAPLTNAPPLPLPSLPSPTGKKGGPPPLPGFPFPSSWAPPAPLPSSPPPPPPPRGRRGRAAAARRALSLRPGWPEHRERVRHGELARREAVEGGRAPALGSGRAALAGGLEQPTALEHPAQVGRVDRVAERGRVDRAQLGDRERSGASAKPMLV